MTIRRAVLSDFDALVAMGQRFLAGTKYARLITLTPDNFTELSRTLLVTDNDQGGILVAEKDDVLVGMIAVVLSPRAFTTETMGCELFWWVDTEHRGCGVRLLRAAELWASERGATIMQMGAPDDRVGRVYAALGYEMTEMVYQRELRRAS